MNAFLFDIDGVLTDPKLKQVTEPKLLDHIISRLEAEEPVCLNTGRSVSWMEERLIDHLYKKAQDKKIFKNFIAVGEKGGTWMTFEEDGSKKYEIDSTITVPLSLQQKVRTLVEETYKESMFFDDTKETMISIEMHDGFDISLFHKEQERLNKEIKAILHEMDYADSLKVDPSIIATDIENNHVGKALGARRFLEFLKTVRLNPEFYTTFGDSAPDIAMADELHERGKKVVFIFVGDKEKLKGITRPYPVEYISGFSQGTLAYLNK